MATASVAAQVLTVDARHRRQAAELAEKLAGHPERLAISDAQRCAAVPPELAGVLAAVVEALAHGGAVTVSSRPEELTTTAAAQELGISRPTLMKLINEGKIPARQVGTHHRVKLRDLRAFQRARIEEQRCAFDELSALFDELDGV